MEYLLPADNIIILLWQFDEKSSLVDGFSDTIWW